MPHSLALDSAGRLYVADRSNSRIQIFDQDGELLAEWKQFGRPSSVFIDKNDVIYVADSQSNEKTNPGFKQGIRIESVKDGKVIAFIPLVDPALGSAEEVAVDDQGNIYAGLSSAQQDGSEKVREELETPRAPTPPGRVDGRDLSQSRLSTGPL